MCLEYSQEVKPIEGVLKSSGADLIIFTEDKCCCKLFYDKLFERIGSQVGLKTKTVQLGSCDDVQKSCETDTNRSYPKLYVIDGDLFLMYEPKKMGPNFFPLNRYCIENFLLDVNAIIELAYFSNGVKDKETLKKELDYDGIMLSLAQEMFPIYHRNVILKCLKDRHENRGWGFFYDSAKKRFKSDVIEREKKTIEQEIKDFVKNDCIVAHLLDDMELSYPSTVSNALIFLSGKDCILSYLICQIEQKTGTNIGMNRNALKLFLAEKCDLNSFSALINKMQEVVDSFKKTA